jgi:hypothetical protein
MAGETDGGAAGTEFVGSHEKAKNGYGQNGFQGPSSDLPGQKTRMDRDFGLPADPGTPNANAKDDDARLAAISGHPVKVHDGMRNRSTEVEKIPSGNVRASKTDGVGRPVKR